MAGIALAFRALGRIVEVHWQPVRIARCKGARAEQRASSTLAWRLTLGSDQEQETQEKVAWMKS